MKALICGSRGWTNQIVILNRLAALPPGTTIIHGDARGADTQAKWAAASLPLKCKAFPADWDKHGKAAGILRNKAMLDEKPDLVIAFWDGKSPGTRHTVEEARKRGIPVEVIDA